jgi:post-segregation antitoxin (ccd killing protein)
MGKEKKKDTIISLRVPEKLKEEMSKMDINWSEYLRKAIEDKISKEKMKKIWNEIENLKDIINEGS